MTAREAAKLVDEHHAVDHTRTVLPRIEEAAKRGDRHVRVSGRTMTPATRVALEALGYQVSPTYANLTESMSRRDDNGFTVTW